MTIEMIEHMTEAAHDHIVQQARFMPRFVTFGRVTHGRQLGRELGIPTANLEIPGLNAPEFGIYAVTAYLDDEELPAIASWGTRPHFDDGAPLLEVHLFNFNRSIYGQLMRVRFDAFLRPEASFESIEAFLAQIDRDLALARFIHGI